MSKPVRSLSAMITASLMHGDLKLIGAVVTGALLAVLIFCSAARAEPPTKVVTFHAAIPEGRPIKGACWTGSVAADRPGAWRCKTKDMIYDPCFAVAGMPSLVVCQDDPFKRQEAIALELTKPLPPAQETRCKDCVWALELADGSTCTVAGTGTLAMVGDQPMRWQCTNPSCSGNACPVVGVVGDLKIGRVWVADKVWARESGRSLEVLERKSVSVRKVWR